LTKIRPAIAVMRSRRAQANYGRVLLGSQHHPIFFLRVFLAFSPLSTRATDDGAVWNLSCVDRGGWR